MFSTIVNHHVSPPFGGICVIFQKNASLKPTRHQQSHVVILIQGCPGLKVDAVDSYKLPVLASLVLASFWIELHALYASGIWRRNDTHRYITLYYILENSHFEPKTWRFGSDGFPFQLSNV